MADKKKEKPKQVMWIVQFKSGLKDTFKGPDVPFRGDITPGLDHFLLTHPTIDIQDITTAYPASWDVEALTSEPTRNIEDTLFTEVVAVNSIAMINRLLYLIRANNCNSLGLTQCRQDPRIQRLMLMLVLQFYGISQVNPFELWADLYTEYKKEKEIQQSGGHQCGSE